MLQILQVNWKYWITGTSSLLYNAEVAMLEIIGLYLPSWLHFIINLVIICFIITINICSSELNEHSLNKDVVCKLLPLDLNT